MAVPEARGIFMDAEARALITRLFAEATAILEDAHTIAVKGQSSKPTARIYESLARKVQNAAHDAATLADAAAVIARRSASR